MGRKKTGEVILFHVHAEVPVFSEKNTSYDLKNNNIDNNNNNLMLLFVLLVTWSFASSIVSS